MEQEKSNDSLIKSVELIYENRDSLVGNSDPILRSHIAVISDFFEVSETTACVLCIIIYEQLLGEAVRLRKILGQLEVKPTRAIKVHVEIKSLRFKGILVDSRFFHVKSKDAYELSKRSLQAIIDFDKELLFKQKYNNQIDAIVDISKLIKFYLKEQECEEFVDVLICQLECYKEYALFNTILSDTYLSQPEKLLLFWMCTEYVLGREIMDLEWAAEHIFDSAQWIKTIQNRINKNAYLINESYISFYSKGIVDFTGVLLGEKLTKLIEIDKKEVKKQPSFHFTNLIMPDDLKRTNLFYNRRNQEQIDELYQMLNPNSYYEIKQRFEREGLPTGLSILLYGPSGTGKTETVKQIAREYQLPILMVDMSQFKNMWLGESEKNIYRIFREYSNACSFYEMTPILLFNEADAILSKRSMVKNSVDQSMNNIQNVLLQQLEDLNGIVIATTNLIENLDSAFDRRFIMKFKIEEPDFETRYHIISDQISFLPDDILKSIAENFQLTGGQIQNIRRRLIAKRVLTENCTYSKEYIMQLAREEVKLNTKSIIGFYN